MLGIGTVLSGIATAASSLPIVSDVIGGLLGGGGSTNNQRPATAKPDNSLGEMFGKFAARLDEANKRAEARNDRVLNALSRHMDRSTGANRSPGFAMDAPISGNAKGPVVINPNKRPDSGLPLIGENGPLPFIDQGKSNFQSNDPKAQMLSLAANLLLNAFGGRNGDGVSISLKWN